MLQLAISAPPTKTKILACLIQLPKIKFRRRLALRDSFWEIGKIG